MDLVENILQSLWPDEADVLDPSTVKDIATNAGGNDILYRTQGGNNFDAENAVRILIEGATLAKITLEIYQLLRKTANKDTIKSQVEDKVRSEPRFAKLSKGIKEKLTDVIEIIIR